MNKRLRGKSDTVTMDLTDLVHLVHPSLRVSNHGGGEIKPKILSSGCVLYGYDMFTYYRKRDLKT